MDGHNKHIGIKYSNALMVDTLTEWSVDLCDWGSQLVEEYPSLLHDQWMPNGCRLVSSPV